MKTISKLLLAAMLSLPVVAWSAEIAFFDNDLYTDTDQESANLVAELEALGHNVNIFSGITAGDFSSALSGANLLVIPELDIGPLAGDLDGAALNAISSFVNAGGGFIGISSNREDVGVFRDVTLWNAVFGFSLVHTDVTTPFTLVSATEPFLGGPATIEDFSAVEGLTAGSLPGGAEIIYEDDNFDAVVSMASYGAGTFIQIGFDWFTDDENISDWNDVLGRAVEAAAGDVTTVPVPSLTGFGLGTLIALMALFGMVVTRRLV